MKKIKLIALIGILTLSSCSIFKKEKCDCPKFHIPVVETEISWWNCK